MREEMELKVRDKRGTGYDARRVFGVWLGDGGYRIIKSAAARKGH